MYNLILDAIGSKVVSWFKTKGDGQKDRGASWKWVIGVIVSLFAVVAVFYLKYKINKKNKLLAKLLHERDVAVEKEHALNLKKDIEEDEVEIAKLDAQLEYISSKINDLETTTKVLDKELTTETIKIDAIENWEDMDRYINNMRDVFNNADGSSGRN